MSPIPLRTSCLTRHPDRQKLARRGRSNSAYPLADELLDIIRPEPVRRVMGAAFVDAGEDVVVAGRLTVRIDIDHGAVDLEQRDHLLDMCVARHESARSSSARISRAESSHLLPVRPWKGSGPGSRPAATSASRLR